MRRHLLMTLGLGLQFLYGAANAAALPADTSPAIQLSGTDWRIHEDADGKGVERRPVRRPMLRRPAGFPPRCRAISRPTWKRRTCSSRCGTGPAIRGCTTSPARTGGIARTSACRPRLPASGSRWSSTAWTTSARCGSTASKSAATPGMFRRFWFDVTDGCRPGQTNRLAVRIAQDAGRVAAAGRQHATAR